MSTAFLSQGLAMSSAGGLIAVTHPIELTAPIAILVGLTVIQITSGFGDNIDVRVQGSNDLQNWSDLSSTNLGAVGYSELGPVTAPGQRFLRLYCVYSDISGNPALLSASVRAADRGASSTGTGAPPAPPG